MTETIPFSNINNNNKGELRHNDNYTFPFAIEDVDPETNATLLEQFTGQFCFQLIFTKCDFNYIKMREGERNGFVQVGPEKYFFPRKFRAAAQPMYEFSARPSDIWVATYPRSGTTWTQELVWMVANHLDYATSQRVPLTERFPFFE